MHGGNIYENENRINLDFSVNTNPLGIPKFLAEAFRHAGEWAGRYPDLEVDALRKLWQIRRDATLVRSSAEMGHRNLSCCIARHYSQRRH